MVSLQSVQHSVLASTGAHKSSNKMSKTSKNSSKSSTEVSSHNVDPDLLSRPAWTNASVALSQIKKGKATGNKAALWLRAKLQTELFKLGRFLQRHAGKVLFVGLLILATFSVGLKSAVLESRVEKLWVEEGGRLEKELNYISETLGNGAGSISQLVIQTPADDTRSTSILTPESLLTHLEVIRAATRVVVEKDDVAWKLKDLCYAPTIPATEAQMVEQIMENLIPCSLITPLDCFWEGSKLLGPDYPVHIPLGGDEGSMMLSWTSLNPSMLLQQMNSLDKDFKFREFEKFMKQAGITTGYQEKPCLNPHDPDCPITAPNKRSRQVPDIGSELTGGCYGFATRYMHWPEQLIVGGTTKNKTGHITRAKGLQSVVQLMGEKEFYDYWSETYKVHTLEWSPEKAKEILIEWQEKFSHEVAHLVRQKNFAKTYDINAFSLAHLDAILAEFSEVNISKIALGYLFMLLYAGLTLFRWSDVVRSQAGLGISGVLLVTITVCGGLGLSAVLGLTFNATTTQIVPFLALGLGVDAMFLLVQTYSEIGANGAVAFEDQVGEVLRRCGPSIILTSVCNMAAFLAAAIIPIPALRSFAFQAAVLVAFNLVTMITLFPTLISLDLRRIIAGKVDLLCCYKAPPVSGRTSTSVIKDEEVTSRPAVLVKTDESYPRTLSTSAFDEATEERSERKSQSHWFTAEDCKPWNLSWFAGHYYGYWITRTPVRLLVIVMCVALTASGIWGLTKVTEGLDQTDVVPRDSTIYRFLRARELYFGFYNMYAVTQSNFEYPQNQKLLYDYHNAFVRVPNIVKDDDGGLPEFWLSLFRNWLSELQMAFDDDMAAGNLHDKGWYTNASSDAILAYKLMVQTGHVDYPVDKTLLHRNRLVDAHGIINANAFYNYLSAWYSNDAMAYSYSQASLVPTPKEWIHDARDTDYRIPKSQPIILARIPFYLNNLADTETTVDTIKRVRQICEKFEERGLPNFPSGIPFTFSEQYVHLRFWMTVGLVSILCAVFVVISFALMSPWIAAVVVVVVATIVVQLFGTMGWFGIKLSAVPALILIVAVGLGVEFTLHICIGFLTSLGSRQRRVMTSLRHMFAPVVHGAASTFFGIVMLAFSHFDFVVRYFFFVLTALIVLGLFNGLVFLPVLLVMFGPPPEVVTIDHSDVMAPPTPELPAAKHRKRGGSMRTATISAVPVSSSGPGSIRIAQSAPAMTNLAGSKHRHNSEISLSTIAEESNSYSTSSSHNSYCCPKADYGLPGTSLNGASVFVEPHVTVETTYGNAGSLDGSSTCSTPTPGSHVTKVTATAKFKVEVHAPTPSASASLERPASSRSRSRRHCSGSRAASAASTVPCTAGACAHVPTPPGSVHSSLSGESVRSSLANSVSSSLCSNDGDLGFSEK